MNCGTCKNWDLKGSPLRSAGFGRCKVEPDLARRAGHTTGSQFWCLIGQYVKAPVAVIARRERELSAEDSEEAT
jgi:hypothetical protein